MTIGFSAQDIFFDLINAGPVVVGRKYTAPLFRDPSAWYHLVATLDTTNATAANRMRLWVNGVQITSFSLSADPALNADGWVNAAQPHAICYFVTASTNHLDCYLAETHFVDGQALTPNDFGETDSNGNWQPKAYAGTYGTNGFYLKFDNATNLTTLTQDSSGNSNNWTANNISLSAGVTYDGMADAPTNNFPTWNPLFRDSAPMPTIADGNLNAYNSATGGWCHTRATQTIPAAGKWYWEWTLTQSVSAGQGAELAIGPVTAGVFGNAAATGTGFAGLLISTQTSPTDQRSISKLASSTFTAYAGQTPAVNDVFMLAYDASTGALWLGRNGTWYDSGDPANGTNPSVSSIPVEEKAIFQASFLFSGQYIVTPINFGQRPFAHTRPSGFQALCTANLPAPTIANPKLHFDIKTRTGTGASVNITGYQFAPDFVWIKSRGRGESHGLYDLLRGVQANLATQVNFAEQTSDNGLTAFNSDGYTLNTRGPANGTAAPNSFVDWAWKANGSGVTNNDGTITSTVSANSSAKFSIVTFTAPSSGGFTIGHGLGVVPKFIIVKARNSISDWVVYHSVLSSNRQYLRLNDIDSVNTSGSPYWNDQFPSSTVFGANTNAATVASRTHVAYCFAEVPGFSRISSYVGNSSTDGPFVYCGFRPAFVLIKRTDALNNWTMLDVKRSGFNVDNDPLFPNLVNAEGTTDLLDLTANGFKVRTTDTSLNTNTGTYAFMAFAEAPFKSARAR
jgi:hypothetical protein